jgi:hypothetical protein
VAGGGSNLHSPEKVAAGRRIEGEGGANGGEVPGVDEDLAPGGRGWELVARWWRQKKSL